MNQQKYTKNRGFSASVFAETHFLFKIGVYQRNRGPFGAELPGLAFKFLAGKNAMKWDAGGGAFTGVNKRWNKEGGRMKRMRGRGDLIRGEVWAPQKAGIYLRVWGDSLTQIWLFNEVAFLLLVTADKWFSGWLFDYWRRIGRYWVV